MKFVLDPTQSAKTQDSKQKWRGWGMREIYLLYNEKRNIIPALKNNMLEQQWDVERHGIWGVTLTLTNHNTLFCSTHMCAHNLVPIHYILTNLGLSGHYSHNIFKPYSITFMNSFLYCVKRNRDIERTQWKGQKGKIFWSGGGAGPWIISILELCLQLFNL